MQPIISPWLFYFVDLLPKIQSACGLLFCLGIMITFFAFMIDKDRETYTNDTWVTITDEKLEKMQWRGICTGISMLVVCGLGMIFIPDQRVILSNNKVGTYRLGQKEKIRLIKLEKKQIHVNS